jgi:hypothetical protein
VHKKKQKKMMTSTSLSLSFGINELNIRKQGQVVGSLSIFASIGGKKSNNDEPSIHCPCLIDVVL